MNIALLHPLGITLLGISVALAVAIRVLPPFDRWDGQAPWLVLWGIAGYAAAVVALRRLDADAMDSYAVASMSTDDLVTVSERRQDAIKRRLRIDALENPSTLVPLAFALAAAVYVWLLVPATGREAAALGLLAASSGIGIGSLVWRLAFSNKRLFVERYQRMLDDLVDERSRARQVEITDLAGELDEGFADIGSASGATVLNDLMSEYRETELALQRHRETDPMALAAVPLLTSETCRRGLGVLSDALELQWATQGSDRRRLKDEITQLDRELVELAQSGPAGGAIEMKRSVRASQAERLELLEGLQTRIDLLLFQAHRCETSLHRTRIELVAIRAGGSPTGVTVVIEALKRTIDRAKEVQEEISKIG